MFDGLVNQFDVMTLGEELYTMCFTAFMVGGAVCCCVRCLQPEAAEETPAIEVKPEKVPRRRKPIARPALPPRPRRPLASRSEARALPHASRQATAVASLRTSMHAPCH